MCLTQLVQLRRIDIQMDNFGVRSKGGLQLPGNTVIEAAPTAISRSHSCTARLAALVPCIPACPDSTDRPHQRPRPFSVQVAGICVMAINSRNAGTACAMPTPPPTYSIGFARQLTSAAPAQLLHGEGNVVINRREIRFKLTLRQLDIFRDINQNRARAARVCDLESFSDHRGSSSSDCTRKLCFVQASDKPRTSTESIGADKRRRDLTSDGDNRDRVQ